MKRREKQTERDRIRSERSKAEESVRQIWTEKKQKIKSHREKG